MAHIRYAKFVNHGPLHHSTRCKMAAVNRFYLCPPAQSEHRACKVSSVSSDGSHEFTRSAPLGIAELDRPTAGLLGRGLAFAAPVSAGHLPEMQPPLFSFETFRLNRPNHTARGLEDRRSHRDGASPSALGLCAALRHNQKYPCAKTAARCET